MGQPAAAKAPAAFLPGSPQFPGDGQSRSPGSVIERGPGQVPNQAPRDSARRFDIDYLEDGQGDRGEPNRRESGFSELPLAGTPLEVPTGKTTGDDPTDDGMVDAEITPAAESVEADVVDPESTGDPQPEQLLPVWISDMLEQKQ